MRAAILLFMFLVAPAGKAQQVYKCVKGRDVSYQSEPCAGTQKIAKQWDATPEPEPSAEALSQRQLKSGRERAGTARRSSAAGTQRTRSASHRQNPKARKPRMSRCDAAKARREAKLKAVGLKRTFDLLRKLDEAVNEACR